MVKYSIPVHVSNSSSTILVFCRGSTLNYWGQYQLIVPWKVWQWFWNTIFKRGHSLWNHSEVKATEPTNQELTMVQVMTCCRQATSHYLNQCWPSSQAPYGITGSQWVNAGGAGEILSAILDNALWLTKSHLESYTAERSLGNSELDIMPIGHMVLEILHALQKCHVHSQYLFKYTAEKISTCPDQKITCPVGHITTKFMCPGTRSTCPGHANTP